MQKSIPVNKKLYETIKNEAKEKFNVWPSAYASGWLVKEYKRRGGVYKGQKPKNDTGLKRWFAEKWINVCKLPKKVPCGRPRTSLNDWKKKYPYCRPSVRVNAKSPKTFKQLSKKELEKRCKKKIRSPLKRISPKRYSK